MFAKRIFLIVLAALLMLGLGAPNAFAGIVYIDQDEVWVASDDGSAKRRLSGGENDWRQVAQSDQGYIVGVRKEAGKVSQTATFTVWDPAGRVVHSGSLSGHIDAGLNAYPTSLDITPDGGLLTYGYSRGYYVGTTFNLQYGSYLKATADGTIATPYSLTGWEDATVVGTRVVAHNNETQVSVQDAASSGSTDFNPWFTFDTSSSLLSGLEVDRSDVAATGNVLATEFRDSSFVTQKILLTKANGLGGTYVDDCVLPASGTPSDITISQNAATIAWQDSRGVVIAGAPDFAGAATCNLTQAPRVISATGKMPSYGPFNATAPAPVPPKVGAALSLKITTKKPKSKAKISAKVKIAAAKKPAGTVRILVDGKLKKTVTIKSASWVSFKLPKLKKGKHQVSATFSGTGFTSPTKVLTVKVR